MFRRRLSLTGLFATAVTGVLLAGSPAAAQQQGWPLTRGAYNGFTVGNSAPAARLSAAPTYSPAYSAPSQTLPATPSPALTEIRSFYPSAAGDDYNALSTNSAVNRSVTINVSVPAGAEILFDGTKTRQAGSHRVFESPPLAPGQDYVYAVTGKWQEGGREVTRTRHITVHSGEVINLSF
jgi:uncharacterized protein (TIGR03000 family)